MQTVKVSKQCQKNPFVLPETYDQQSLQNEAIDPHAEVGTYLHPYVAFDWDGFFKYWTTKKDACEFLKDCDQDIVTGTYIKLKAPAQTLNESEFGGLSESFFVKIAGIKCRAVLPKIFIGQIIDFLFTDRPYNKGDYIAFTIYNVWTFPEQTQFKNIEKDSWNKSDNEDEEN